MEPKATKKRVQLTLPQALYQALAQQAQEEVRTVPAQIRHLLRECLEQNREKGIGDPHP